MVDAPYRDPSQVAAQLRQQMCAGAIRVTIHGHREMVAEDIGYEAVRQVLLDCEVVENYPDHQRGPCCLVCGRAASERFLHIVCTTSLDVVIIITAYEPKPPKWVTPFERGGRD